MKKSVMLLVTVLFAVVSVFAGMSGYDVMKKVDERYVGDDGLSKIKMVIVNSRKQERHREIVVWRKKVDNANDLSYSFIYFIKPADVKDTTFMVQERAGGADDDQWIYLPATRKVRMISSSEKDKSFMGTDFSYDDMSDRDIDEYYWELMGSETFNGYDCYIVKGTKKDKKKASYDHTIFWVTKEHWIPVKAVMYDRKKPGKVAKIMIIDGLRKVQGIWTPLTSVMYTMKPIYREGRDIEKSFSSKTILTVESVKYNVGLSDSVFTKRNMKRPEDYKKYLD